MPVQIVNGSGDVIADSRVSFISPQVDNTTQTVLIKSRIANNEDRLRNLQFIRARVIWGTHQGPVVPMVAVSRLVESIRLRGGGPERKIGGASESCAHWRDDRK